MAPVLFKTREGNRTGADRGEGRRQRALWWMGNTGEERDVMKRSNMDNRRKNGNCRKVGNVG